MAKTVDIVVYGAGFAGVAAVAKAASNSPNAEIALIVPDPVPHNGSGSCLGGLGTIGGQNFFDIRKWNFDLVTKGSFSWWYRGGQHYGVDDMAALLQSDLDKYYPRITYYYGYDIVSIGWTSPAHITSVKLAPIKRATDGNVIWESGEEIVNGTVFIDASDSGRLTQLSNFGGTAGRYDFPAQYLDADEKTSPGKGRQQAATLMFKVTGVNKDYGNTSDLSIGDNDNNGVYSANGGTAAYKNKNGNIYKFNEKYGPNGFAIKPFNAAQDGPNSDEWWVNTLLVFNVDGRAYNRDRTGNSSKAFPSDMRSDYKTVDDGWVDARDMINTDEFENAIRDFPAFENVKIVKKNGMPVVGEVLYLRETIHSALSSSSRANGTENSNYALRANDCNEAGSSSSSGLDSRNYAKRIGLNFYFSDINAYKFEDLKDASGNYIWFNEVGQKVRPDLDIHGDNPDLNLKQTPVNPVYVPYSALATNFVYNLLIPGYASGMSSFAWAEGRTLPNLCVMGDAAGVAAAYAINNNIDPLNFSTTDIKNIQNTLKNSGVRLEK